MSFHTFSKRKNGDGNGERIKIFSYLTSSRGWDWGPILNTCGPWRPVYLETHEARITDIRVEYKLIGDDLTDASGTISADITCSHNFGIVVVEFAVRKGQNVVLTESVNVNAESQFTTKVKFRIKKPELWYPYTMGHQPLYTVLATLRSSGKDLHTESRKIGFRKAELIQKPDKGGKSFYFRINNIDMFAGGSNWIPADCFIPRISKSKYHKWLKIVKEGGQSMIRYDNSYEEINSAQSFLTKSVQSVGRWHLGRRNLLRSVR